MTTTLSDRIHRQSAGSPPTEAAARIITGGCRGTLLGQVRAWIEDYPDTGTAWIDYRAALDGLGYLSSGEHRLVLLAGSLATWGEDDSIKVNLNDALTGLDDHNARLVAGALAHALGVPLVGR
jgi:hypothetical protein